MSIEETLDLPPTPEAAPLVVVPPVANLQNVDDPEKDLIFTAENSMDQTISAGVTALEHALAAAKDTGLPAAYMALSGLITAISTANQTKINIRHSKAKIDLDRRKSKLIDKKIEVLDEPSKPTTQTNVVDQSKTIVFQGSMDDLKKQLKAQGVLKEHFLPTTTEIIEAKIEE